MSWSTSEKLQVELRGHTAIITIDNPGANTWDTESLPALEDLVEKLTAKGMTQKDLAQAMDKRESEVSRWLAGEHNLTLKSIAKLEAALGMEIITVIHSDFLEWKETQVPHMTVLINKDAAELGRGVAFQEPVHQVANDQVIAS